MHDTIFKDLLGVDKVRGVLFISNEGKLLYSRLNQKTEKDVAGVNWVPVVQAVSQLKEADLLYLDGRLYIRQAHGGYLIVTMDREAPAPMVRLNCDLIMPTLKQLYGPSKKSTSKLSRFFKGAQKKSK